MTEREIIIAQRKHYAEAMQKAVNYCLLANQFDLAEAIRQLSNIYGIETTQIIDYSCINGRATHSFRNNSNKCYFCNKIKETKNEEVIERTGFTRAR